MRATISWVLRAGLAALFLYAGVAKLVDVRAFASDIANYRVVPASLIGPFAAALPGVEIVCGLALLRAATARAGAVLATALVIVFTAAAAQALVRDINIDCGCFGSVRAPVTVATIVRDVVFLAAGVAAIVFAPAPNEKAPRAERPGG
jgi:hypothetical protein